MSMQRRTANFRTNQMFILAPHMLDDPFVSGFVYIDEVSMLKAMMMQDYHSNNQTCSVYVVTLKDQYFKLALAAPKDSSLLDVFDPT